MIIAIDFDGTVVTHDFPNIGEEIGAVPVLRRLVAEGHQLILFTMRSDREEVKPDDVETGNHKVSKPYLSMALQWFIKHDIPLYGININPTQKNWTDSPKAYAELYIDDAALGCPLIHGTHLRPYVDWHAISEMFWPTELKKDK